MVITFIIYQRRRVLQMTDNKYYIVYTIILALKLENFPIIAIEYDKITEVSYQKNRVYIIHDKNQMKNFKT